jgi:excisionase family DNA binding protein
MAISPLRALLQKQKLPLTAQPLYTLRQAGELVGLGTLQMRRYVKSGVVKAIRLHPRGHFKIPQSELEKFL